MTASSVTTSQKRKADFAKPSPIATGMISIGILLEIIPVVIGILLPPLLTASER